MRSGELIVVGKDHARIFIGGIPSEIIVNFRDEEKHLVSCSPHKRDELEFEIVEIGKKIYLIIKWNVSNVREINWIVRF